jgi:hypothetical protein
VTDATTPSAPSPEPFGPEYPELGRAVAKIRAKAKNGIAALSKAERVAYANAIEERIRSLQRSEAARTSLVAGRRPNCASRTYLSDGAQIIKAIQKQQRDALQAAVVAERRNRTDEEWQQMYDAAMKEKRERAIEAAKPPEKKRAKRCAKSPSQSLL